MAILTLILTTITQLLPFLTKVIGLNWTDLITAITNAIDALWAAFKSGNVTTSVLVSMQQLQAVLTAIQNDTGASSEQLALAAEIAGIVTAGIAGLQAAEAGADPANLPIPPAVE